MVANISLATEKLNPPNASDYLALSWDYKGRLINPREAAQVTLTLSVSSTVYEIESFFDIIISVSG
ncbi:MAG: hypothetical protein ACPLZY_01555 [Candidatus Norongarragalinales archaeon]